MTPAMAAGVADWVQEMRDIPKLLKASEAKFVTRGPDKKRALG